LGMQTMNQGFVDLYRKRLVTKAEILGRATEFKDLERLLKMVGG